jgi:hypothetical protein
MLELGTSGTVGGEGGNVLVYPARFVLARRRRGGALTINFGRGLIRLTPA